MLRIFRKVQVHELIFAVARTKEVLQWLSVTDPSINHGKARQRHESSTGSWFVGSTDFDSWKTASKSFLWLHGLGMFLGHQVDKVLMIVAAGSGKTILR